MDEFHRLYERHYPAVYRLALFLTGAPDRAEDLAADTFVRAWTARDRIRYATVRAYLLTITRNLYRDQLRAARTFVELDETLSDRRPAADLHLEHASTLRDVRQGLTQVAPGDRRALVLHAVREMSYADVAQRLGVSLDAVKSRIARTRDALRAAARRHTTGGIGK
jgi:RNA polymerase sigma-70 factor (ECF subfamily)